MNFDCKNTIIRHRIFKKCYKEIDNDELTGQQVYEVTFLS